MIHIGKLIKEVFDQQPKSHTVKWFASQLHCERANVYKIFNKQNIDVQLLYHISKVLNYNFFADLSNAVASDINIQYISSVADKEELE